MRIKSPVCLLLLIFDEILQGYMIPTKEKLDALYTELGKSDRELAEAGFANYAARLKSVCAKLDPREEQAFAEIGVSADLAEWPEC